MQRIAVFLALLSLTLVLGVRNGKNLNVNGDSDTQLTTQDGETFLYSVFIPENTQVFNVTLTATSTGDNCEYYLYTRTDAFPCNEYSGESDYIVCHENTEYADVDAYIYSGAGSNSAVATFVPGYNVQASDAYSYLPAGGYIFFEVESDYSNACSFTISTSATSCPALAGNTAVVGVDTNSYSSNYASTVLGSQSCAAYITVPISGSIFQVNATGPTVFKVTLPLNTAYVNITGSIEAVNATVASSTSISVFGTPKQAAAVTNYGCYDQSADTFSLQCTDTPAGSYYITVFATSNDDDYLASTIQYAGNITITPFVCPAGTVYYNSVCNAILDPTPLFSTAVATPTLNFTVPGNSEYFTYLDIPFAFLGSNFSLTFLTGGNYPYITFSRTFYVYSSASNLNYYGYESISANDTIQLIAPFDLNNFFGGYNSSATGQLQLNGQVVRYFFSFYCSGSTACPVYLIAGGAQGTATTGGVSTASTAAVSTASTAAVSTASTAAVSTASTAAVSTASTAAVSTASTAAVSTASTAAVSTASTAAVSTASTARVSTASTAAVSTTATTARASGASSVVPSIFVALIALFAMMF